jgi:hypothetical protein
MSNDDKDVGIDDDDFLPGDYYTCNNPGCGSCWHEGEIDRYYRCPNCGTKCEYLETRGPKE